MRSEASVTKHEQETNMDANGARDLGTRQHTAPAATDAVDFRDKVDILDYEQAAGGPQRQEMRGFDPDYVDIVDYVIRCTHKIWEEGGIGLIYDHYTQNTTVWSDWGMTYGRERTMEYVIQRLAGFPDYRLYGDDVVWAGDDAEGFRTCHRFVQTGHNTGWSKYGSPTGRRVQFRAFANCVVRENRIVEEWLVHDEIAIVRQLGLDLDTVLYELSDQVDADAIAVIASEVPRVVGQLMPTVYTPKRPNEFDVEDFVRQGLHEIWNWRLLNKIPAFYAPTCTIHGPAARNFSGHGEIKASFLSLLAAFPDAMLEIDDLYFNGNERDGYRTAVRWTLMGTHRGISPYGRPTGKQIRILGTTQHHIKGGKVIEEWMLFNELALLWKLRHGGHEV